MTAKTALVTGGTRGIGRAVAHELANLGHDLYLVYRSNAAAAEKSRNDISGNSGRKVVLIKADVSDADSVARLAADVTAGPGQLDVLVNNAGAMPKQVTIDTIGLDEWNQIVATNLTSMFLMTKHMAPLLRKSPAAHIINISSIAGQTGGTIGVAYAASKGAVIALSQALARELAPSIRVNSIAPGPVDTDFLGEELKRKLRDLELTKRIVAPEEIASAVRFLLSAQTVTGQCLTLNGGRYMSR